MKSYIIISSLVASSLALSIPWRKRVASVTTHPYDPDLVARDLVDPSNPTVNPEDPQCLYYCDQITPETGMPLISEAKSLAADLLAMDPNARVAISRPQGSHDPARTTLISSGGTEVNIFYNDAPRMWTAYYAEFWLAQFGDFVNAIVDVCKVESTNELRVFGQTDVPNCRHVDGTLQWYPNTPDQKPGTYPGIRVEVVRAGNYGPSTGSYWKRSEMDGAMVLHRNASDAGA